MVRRYGRSGPIDLRTVAGAVGLISLLLVSWLPSVGVGGPVTSLGAPTAAVARPGNPVHSDPPARPVALPDPGVPFHPYQGVKFHVPGRHPQSWGGRDVPPGAPAPKPALLSGSRFAALAGNGSGWNWSALSQYCFGLWPYEGGQGQYLPNCYGHDEPGVDPYSNLPGSGGNVTWTIVLPTDRNATENQSDLYTAIWFGMVLTDPYAWLDECFLELQFYPDSSWTGVGSANGNWIGAAVAWQIEAATGFENPCFYQVLTAGIGGNYFNMNQGDTIRVTMTGWAGSSTGEQLVIFDLTSGVYSNVTLYNGAQAYPLNPSYSTASYQNALQWTPGGQLPVSFSFENGHTVPPFPNNNSYGGCSAGPFPPTPIDSATPCPSYDPASWANDTTTPWQIAPPTFFNATTTQAPAQVAFSHDFGGIAMVDPLSSFTCTGRDGSSYCSYPWFSYSCKSGAYEFGATDYPGMTRDFGQFNEYDPVFAENAQGLGYYPPSNYSVPACGAPTATVTAEVSAGTASGSLHFLKSTITTPMTFANLSEGNYSISAAASPGSYFSGWSTTGGAIVQDPSSPWTSLRLFGSGTVNATFSSTPTKVQLSFIDSGGHGWQAIATDLYLSNPVDTVTVPINGTFYLSPGIYSIQAYPSPGFEFTQWVTRGVPLSIAAPTMPFTWLVVSGSAPTASLSVDFAPSSDLASVSVTVTGTGTVDLAGGSYTAGGGTTLSVGTYAFDAIPGPGEVVQSVNAFGSDAMIDYHDHTNITFENGSSAVFVTFTAGALVTVHAPANSAGVLLDFGAPEPNGSAVPLFQSASTEYPLVAMPVPGEKFSNWSVSPASALQVVYPRNSTSPIIVNGSGTLTANYQSSSAHSLWVNITPAGAGSVLFEATTTVLTNTSLLETNASYLIQALPAYGYSFVGWTNSGATNVILGGTAPWPSGADRVSVTSPGGGIVAHFVHLPSFSAPVTYVSSPAGATVAVDGQPVVSGVTLSLATGVHTLIGTQPTGKPVRDWAHTGNLTISGGPASYNLTVNGSGAFYVLAIGPLDALLTATPGTARAPVNVTFRAFILNGTAPYNITWGFGDGLSVAYGPVATHEYVTNGRFTATATVVDNTSTRTVRSIVVPILPPLLGVGAAANVTAGIAPLDVQFNATGRGGLPPYGFSWNFGDQSPIASGSVVIHQYTAAGVFYPKVTVNSTDDQRVSTTLVIDVVAPLAAFVTATPTSGFAPLLVNFSGAATGGLPAYNYSWQFGDGGSAYGIPASHLYAAPGTFHGTLTVTDSAGGHAAAPFQVVASRAPLPLVASLTITPTNVTLGAAVDLVVNASGGSVPYYYGWTNLPPGCIDVNSNSLHCTPTATGAYVVRATVTDLYHRSASAAQTLTVSIAAPTGPNGSTGGSNFLSSGVLLVIVALVAVVAVAAIIVARRRKPPAPPEPEPPQG